jgi:REP element-mobilizing transposase RayT
VRCLVRVAYRSHASDPRGQAPGHTDHVLNRGNGGATVFHKDGDYAAFLRLLSTAKTKFSVKVLAFCLMPNHFHLVVQPATEAALSAFMQWWMKSHVRRYHQHYKSHGHALRVFPFSKTRIADGAAVCIWQSSPCRSRCDGHGLAMVQPGMEALE